MSEVQIGELTPADSSWAAALDVLGELRDSRSREELLALVDTARAEGYRVMAVLRAGLPVAVAGFRVMNNTSSGRHLYVDDLVTAASERSCGHGARLLERLREVCVEEGCETLQLDSGIQRVDAHRFYKREGLAIHSYHFTQDVA